MSHPTGRAVVAEPGHHRPDHARRAVRLWWPNLPLLLGGSLPVTLGWLVVRSVAPGLTVLSLLLTGLVVLPALLPLVRAARVLLDDEHVRVTDFARGWGGGWLAGVRVALPLTVALLLTCSAVNLWWATRQTWMLASVGLGLTACVVLLYTAVVALPTALPGSSPAGLVTTSARNSLVRHWLAAFVTAAHHPVPVLAVISAAGLGVWATLSSSVAVSILIPGPLALVWAAALASSDDPGPFRPFTRAGSSPTSPAHDSPTHDTETHDTERRRPW